MDMKKAGINPVLAAQNGLGGGPSAGAPMASGMQNPGAAAAPGISSAAGIMRDVAQINKTIAETEGTQDMNEVKKNIGSIAKSVQPVLKDIVGLGQSMYEKAKENILGLPVAIKKGVSANYEKGLYGNWDDGEEGLRVHVTPNR